MAKHTIGSVVDGATRRLGTAPKPDSYAGEQDPEQPQRTGLRHRGDAYVVEPEKTDVMPEATNSQRVQTRRRNDEDVIRKAMCPVIGET